MGGPLPKFEVNFVVAVEQNALPATGRQDAAHIRGSPIFCFTTFMGVSCTMEKRRPTYEIEAIKLAIGAIDKLAMTVSALRDASRLGFDRAAIVETIVAIERRMFVKSMTTFADPRVWQDVYHVPARGLTLYVKFQGDVVTEFKVVSFKEK
jgi:motility quorum-sensing regulator/GCU-specific mRNA interferase toxin